MRRLNRDSAGRRGLTSLFCSIACLAEHSADRHRAEQELNGRFGEDAETSKQRLATLVENLLFRGHSLKGIAEKIGIPHRALREMLREAGIDPAKYAPPPTPPTPRPEYTPTPGTDAVSELNQRHQRKEFGSPKWITDQAGPSHQPTITATVSVARGSAIWSGTGTAHSKAAARQQAAAALLDDLRDLLPLPQ